MNLTVCHPGDPVPKGRPQIFKGRGVTPKRTRDAEKELRDFAKARMGVEGLEPFEGPLRVRLSFSRATARRCDLDNLAKLVLDALNGVAFKDDSQIVELVARKDIDRAHPCTVVEVEEVP